MGIPGVPITRKTMRDFKIKHPPLFKLNGKEIDGYFKITTKPEKKQLLEVYLNEHNYSEVVFDEQFKELFSDCNSSEEAVSRIETKLNKMKKKDINAKETTI